MMHNHELCLMEAMYRRQDQYGSDLEMVFNAKLVYESQALY